MRNSSGHRKSQRLAYRQICDGGLLPRMRLMVYKAIYLYQEDNGVTSGELDRIISSEGDYWTRSASPRLNELVKLGVINELPLRRCAETNQTVIAYCTNGSLPNPLGLSGSAHRKTRKQLIERITKLKVRVQKLQRKIRRLTINDT